MRKYIQTYVDGDYSIVWLNKNFSDFITITKEEIFDFIAKEQPRKLYINFENVSFIDDECIGLIVAVKNFAKIYSGITVLNDMLPSVYTAIKLAGLGYMIEQ